MVQKSSKSGRRIRTDSPKTEAEMMQAKPPDPPSHVHIREGDLPFWYSIVMSREHTSWTEVDLEYAAVLARTQADIERVQSEIDLEGDMVPGARGQDIANPKHGLLKILMGRAVSLARLLHVHPEATKESGEERKRNTKQREQNAKRQAISDNPPPDEDTVGDDLIAPPMGNH